MSIIDQLERTVTPALLGDKSSVAHISLLEQFYAILAARLALPQVYSQLLRSDQNIISENVAESPLFEQLWQDSNTRQIIVKELAAAHHIDEVATARLLINAAPLVYLELKTLASGQFLPAFLQAQQPTLRQYLPVWSAPVIAFQPADDASLHDLSAAINPNIAPTIKPTTEPLIEPLADNLPENTDAIRVNPSEHHTSETRTKIRQRNQRDDWLIRLLLLVGSLLAIGLVWALFFKDNAAEPVEPVVATPIVTEPETPTQVLSPVQLMVGVDNNGNLSTCTATVGDVTLQAALRQALTTSFGEQAGTCEVTVEEGVATTLANMNIETLPNILTLMRATPFSRLELQNDSISLGAADNILLQGLLVEVRSLVPTMTVTSVAPIAIAQPPANTYDETYNNSNYNNGDNGNYNNNDGSSNDGSMSNDGALANNNSAPITTDNNVITNQSSAGNTNNSEPAAQNNQFAQPSGPISPDEADNLTNPIMSDRLPAKSVAE